MNQIDKVQTKNIDDGLEEAYSYYLDQKEKLGVKPKGILDLIKEDPALSRKNSYEEAVLMYPSILEGVEHQTDNISIRLRKFLNKK